MNLLFVLGVTCFIFLATGTELFVSVETGSSSSNCGETLEHACKSVKDVMSRITDNTVDVTINILPGIYSGTKNYNLTFNFPQTKSITIQKYNTQEDDEEVLFECSNSTTSFFIKNENSQNLTMEGISITNCWNGIGYGPSTSAKNPEYYLTIQNISMTNCFHCVSIHSGNLIAQESNFFDLPQRIELYYKPSAIYLGYGQNIVQIKSCLFENTNTGFSILTDGFQHYDVSIDSCEFYNFGAVSIDGGSAFISNCIFSNFTADRTISLDMISLGNYDEGVYHVENCEFSNYIPDSGNYDDYYYYDDDEYDGFSIVYGAVINFHYYSTGKLSNISIDAPNSIYGIFCDYCALEIKNSLISNSNTGIFAKTSNDNNKLEFKFDNVSFNNCSTDSIRLSGYIYDGHTKYFQSISLSNCNFQHSGRFYANGAFTGRISDSNFTQTLDEERAILIKGSGEWYFDNISVYDTAFPGGVNIHYKDAKASFTNCNFDNNRGDNGAAIFFDGSIINIDNCYFNDNHANDNGGAIYLKDGVCNIEDSSFVNNYATSGPAIYCSSGTINQNGEVIFTDNSSETGGEDIYCSSNLTTIILWILVVGFVLFVLIIIVLLIIRVLYKSPYKFNPSEVNIQEDY